MASNVCEMVRGGTAAMSRTSSCPVFTVQGLRFAYRVPHEAPHVIFEGLDLRIPEGKITTLIGANGSGKTTLFNLLTKNLAPDGGRIFLRRGDIAPMRLRDFSKLVAIVHQHNTAPADLTVAELVGYGRSPHRSLVQAASTEDDEHMVAWALQTAGLQEFKDRPVSLLSGGQRQRAWIAMALAQGTRVLLLDEPTTYLDVRYQLETLQLIRRLNREHGITVIMILHDINQALRYSDEVVALADGRIVAQGTPEDVVTADTVRRVYGVDLEIVTVHGRPFVVAL